MQEEITLLLLLFFVRGRNVLTRPTRRSLRRFFSLFPFIPFEFSLVVVECNSCEATKGREYTEALNTDQLAHLDLAPQFKSISNIFFRRNR